MKKPKGKFEIAGAELGRLVDIKQTAYGNSFDVSVDLLRRRLQQYQVEISSAGDCPHYLIPDNLLGHILTITRIDDKLNRIMTSPDGDGMGESPYQDIAGYGLLGARAQERTHPLTQKGRKRKS